MNRSLTAAIASVFALTGVGGLAQAQTGAAETAEVRIADLNLSSKAGQAALDRRVEGAARRVCEVAAPLGSRAANHIEQSRCKAQVRQQVAAALPR
jgi:UrcA family protein